MQEIYKLVIALSFLVTASAILIFGIILLIEDKDNWPIVQGKDYSNWVTLTVEIGVGIVIAAVIFVITTFQQKEIRKILQRQDASAKMKEINTLSSILSYVKLTKLILDNLQLEIELRRKEIVYGSDKRITGYRDTIRNITQNMKKIDYTDILSSKIPQKANEWIIGLEHHVDHWNIIWDVKESKILNDVFDLLDTMDSYVSTLIIKK